MIRHVFAALPLMALSIGLTSCAESGLPTDAPETSAEAVAFLGQPVITSTTGVAMVDLGVPEGEDPVALSNGYGINQRGQVVGVSGNFAFLWTRQSGFENLGIGFAEALYISESGRVTVDRDFGCPGVAMGFIWRQGTSVNNRGVIAGWSDTGSGEFHAVLWIP